jgi:glycerol-1-phosphate dehydrogenase [NAD(P)+]
MQARIQAAFAALDPSGGVAQECWADYQLKLAAWHARRERTAAALRDWPTVRAALQERLRTWRQAALILERAGAPLRFDELDPPAAEADVRFAFFSAPLIRRRLTLGDLFVFLNWDAASLWSRVWLRDQLPAPAPSAVPCAHHP